MTTKIERYTEELLLKSLKINLGDNIIASISEVENVKVFAQEFSKMYKNKISSKNGKSTQGRPEFHIYNKKLNIDIVVECKGDVNDHEKAVTESRHYMREMKKISKNELILGMAMSGQKKNYKLTISYFTNYDEIKEIFLVNEVFDIPTLYFKFIKEKTETENKQDLLEVMQNVNKNFHSIGINAKDRAQILSAILAASQDNSFIARYKTAESFKDLSTDIQNSARVFFTSQELADKKINGIIESYRYSLENLKRKNIKKFKEIISDIISSPLIIRNYQNTKHGVDLLGSFFNTFLRYGTTEGKALGQVLTPDHIADLFTELTNNGSGLQLGNQVTDITCGTGAFLVQSLTKLFSKAKTDEQRDDIRKWGVWGNERDTEIQNLAIINNVMHGDGKNNIEGFDAIRQFEELKRNWESKEKGDNISHALLNPPYYKKDLIPPEFDFAVNASKIVKQGGEIIMIAPVSLLINNNRNKERDMMLSRNTLKAAMIMPKNLFQPYAGVETAITIWTVGTPHIDLETGKPHSKTWLADWSDDGFKLRKNRGRVDLKEQWGTIKNKWLSDYKNKIEIDGYSINVKVDNINNPDWTIYRHMNTDWSFVNDVDNFKDAVRDLMALKIKENGIEIKEGGKNEGD